MSGKQGVTINNKVEHRFDGAIPQWRAEDFQAIVTKNADAMIVIDHDGHILYVNPAAEALFGLPASEMVGAVFGFPIILEEPVELHILREFKEFIAAEMRLVEVIWAGVPAYLISFRDLTERMKAQEKLDEIVSERTRELTLANQKLQREIVDRKRAEETLRKAEEYTRRIIASSADCIKVLDLEGNLLSMSEGGQSLLEISDLSCYLNKCWVDFWREQDQSNVRRAIETARAGGTGTFQAFCPSEKGTPKWWDVIITPIQGPDGRTEQLLAVSRDVTERKQAEEALRESEERLHLAQKAAKWGIFEYNFKSGKDYWPAETEALYGLKPGEFGGSYSDWLRLVNSDDRAKAELEMEHSLETGEYSDDFRVIWPDGSIHWLYTSAKVFRDDDGKPERMVGVNVDITERKQVEEALKESESRFRTLADNIPNLAWMADANGWIFWYNKQWYDFTGTTLEEMQGWGWQKVHHPDYVKAVTDEWSASIEEGKPYDNIFPLRGKDGDYRWFLTRVTPIKDESGKIQRWFGTNTDITERKQLEESLKLSRFTMDHARDMIFWFKPDGHIVYVNEATCERFGYEKDELLKLTIFDINPNYTEESWRARWQMLRNKGSYMYRTENRTKDGSFFHIEISASYIVYGGKELLFAFARDITERIQAEEALKESKEQAELYVDLMGHDINNMNQSAMGYLELALDTLETDGKIGLDGKLLIEKPLQAIQSSSTLIENVRKLQRLITEGIKTKPVDLLDMFNELKAYDFHASDKEVTVNFEEIPHYVAMGDELLRDVFYNLINNAVKHSRPDKPVTVDVRVERTEEDGWAYYKCIVEDDGPGIPDVLKPRLFHRFQRGKTKAHGKGLGLYLIRTLVDGYHGRVWVEDRVPGDHTQGARFVILLPSAEK